MIQQQQQQCPTILKSSEINYENNIQCDRHLAHGIPNSLRNHEQNQGQLIQNGRSTVKFVSDFHRTCENQLKCVRSKDYNVVTDCDDASPIV